MRINDSGEIYLKHEEQLYSVHSYQLRMSNPNIVSAIHYEDDRTRHLIVGPTMSNQFIFELHFLNRYYVKQAPGMIIFQTHLSFNSIKYS